MQLFEDRLSKYLVASLYEQYTHVEVGTELLPDSFHADVLLIPHEPLPTNIPGAGLLSRLTGEARGLVEAFSGTVHEVRLEANLSKLRLALQRAHQDQKGQPYPRGVLWLLFNYWPRKALQAVFAHEGELIEPGLRCWQGLPRETIYVINTSELEFREETLLFCLLGTGRQRQKAVLKIFEERMEPYATLLNQFDDRFRQMAHSQQLGQLDSDTLKDLKELKDTREEVLRSLGMEEGIEAGRKIGLELGLEEGRELGLEEGRELGLEEGRELGLEEGKKRKAFDIAQKLLATGMKPEQVAAVTELSLEEIQSLS